MTCSTCARAGGQLARLGRHHGAQCDVEVQVRVTQDDPAGSPSWGDWRRITATDIVARGVQTRAILRTADSILRRASPRARHLDEVA